MPYCVTSLISNHTLSLHSSFCVGVPYMHNRTWKVPGGAVEVKWISPLEGACPVRGYNVYYREMFSRTEKSKWNSVAVDRNINNHIIYLNCWKEYEIAVTSLISKGESAFKDSQVWRFRTLGGIINGDGDGTLSIPSVLKYKSNNVVDVIY